MGKGDGKEAEVVEMKPTEGEAQEILEERAQKRAKECDSKIKALLDEMDCHFRVMTFREGPQSNCHVVAVPNPRR